MTGPRPITTSRSSGRARPAAGAAPAAGGAWTGWRRLHALLAEHARRTDADGRPGGASGSRPTVARGCRRWSRPATRCSRSTRCQAARYRERHATSGAKSDPGDAHVLAEIVRLDRAHHRPVAGDSDLAEHVKVLARAHQTHDLGPARGRSTRLRSMLREFYPGRLAAFADLAAADALAVLAGRADPGAGRAGVAAHDRCGAAPRPAASAARAERAGDPGRRCAAPQLASPAAVEAAYAAAVRLADRVITRLNTQIERSTGRWRRILAGTRTLRSTCPARPRARPRRPGARRVRRRPRPLRRRQGPQELLRHRTDHPRLGHQTVVLARYARNRRLADALHQQAFCALTASPGARAYYDATRARGNTHHPPYAHCQPARRHPPRLPRPTPPTTSTRLAHHRRQQPAAA